jgi:hypothetical protein
MYPSLHHHHHVHFMFTNTFHITTNQKQRYSGVVSFSLNRNSQREIKPKPKPARDRVINFGKYKGNMLGTLPSTYLKWVSKNLRAGEFEDWAKFADEVLVDPIYKDRIEWEFALNLLSGNKASSAVVARSGAVAVKLQEISERFGWDNNDKVGWSKIDFNRLGTSYGGRIPRLVNRNSSNADADADSKTNQKPSTGMSSSSSSSSRSRRMERRERQKMRLRSSSGGTHEEVEQEKEDMVADNEEVEDDDIVVDTAVDSRFPGRQALLWKVINRRTIS